MTHARRSIRAFTLVELIIVMALLAIVTAIAAPSLGRSMKERHIDDETKRFLSATEYARSEAVSQGVPMVVWADFDAHHLGIEAKAGFAGEPSRNRDYVWNPDVFMEADSKATVGKTVNLIEFSPDGSVAETSVEFVKLTDRFGNGLVVTRTSDRWSYEILQPR